MKCASEIEFYDLLIGRAVELVGHLVQRTSEWMSERICAYIIGGIQEDICESIRYESLGILPDFHFSTFVSTVQHAQTK